MIEIDAAPVVRYITFVVGRLLDEGRRAMGDALAIVRDYAAEYPPESDANRPAHGAFGPFYQRGVGASYKRQDGTVTVYSTSERLGDSWETDVMTYQGAVAGRTRPTASYGPYVHADAKQAAFHRRRGWRTMGDALRAKRREALAQFEQARARALRGLQNR